ncbi:hypothetical protein IC235_06195 [Hymenobacter sp. BT664]|uniref:Uncharacterized protein n=1 Tax=Hymenobacter montanus TaxID=2771359 RepID=A0A927BB37_9BACT|nr:hypothetical protein [Hymenobacter montanus]MBD2767480.1 hypothetical protein [Hymenobacter montanus]
MDRTTWQTDTVTITPKVDIARLAFVATGSTGSPNYTRGALLLDNLRTLTGLVLRKADSTAQPADKPFRLLWQPILTTGDLDSLAQPQPRGMVRTFQGGRVPLPPALQVTDAKGFYFYQEATPAAGQDTLYYGLYVRNKALPNGAKDDTLRHLYQCRRTFGSQTGLLTDSLAPLAFRGPAAPAAGGASRGPTAPQRRPAPLAEPRPGLRTPRQRGRQPLNSLRQRLRGLSPQSFQGSLARRH